MAEKPSYEELQRTLSELQREVLERRRAEAVLENDLRNFRELYELAVAMTSHRSLDVYLRLIVDKCREILRCEISYIALRDEARDDFFKHTFSGIRTEAFKDLRLPSGSGIGGLVVRTRQGHIVGDYLEDKSFDHVDDRIITGEGIVSGMAVPILMGAKILGVLYVFNRTKTAFSRSDLDTLFLIANLAAVEITRKQAENLLRESEERFRFIVRTTGDVIYRLHYDSMTYDYLSPGIGALTGYSPEEIKALGFGCLITRIDLPEREDVPPRLILEDRLAGKTGEYRADYLITTKSGSLKWLRDHSFPWFDDSGALVGSVGILSDVTDYKNAEDLLRRRTIELTESEEKYRTLVENVPLVVYRAGPTGEVSFINQFVEELIGYGPDEILRRPGLWSEAVYEEDRARVGELRLKARSEGRELVVEYRVTHKDKHAVHVVEHAIPRRSPDGSVTGVDGIIMDVTGRVRLQEKLIQSEGIKTIGEVSARLAHEIRNPLVSAGGFARRLLSSIGPNDPNREKVEIIVKEVGRLESILRMILNYIQPTDLEISPTDPNQLVETALRGFEADAERKKVTIRSQLTPGLPDISVDHLQMKQVLKSLLKNALSRMSPGGALSVATSMQDDMCRLVVRYPVPRLSQDDIDHFFYPFTTSSADYPTDLPMSKIIVHKHGGAIDVKLEKPGDVLIQLHLPFQARNIPTLHA